MGFYEEIFAMLAIPFLTAIYIAITIAAIAAIFYAVQAVIWIKDQFVAFHQEGVERLRQASKNSVSNELKSI